DGEKGIYRIQATGYLLTLPAPATNLPHEIAVLSLDKPTRTGGLQQGYLALPPQGSVTLKFTAMPRGTVRAQAIPNATLVRVRDAAGKALLDTTLLDIGKRDFATVDLKSGDKMQTWSCMMFS